MMPGSMYVIVTHRRTCGCHLLSHTVTHSLVRLNCDLFTGCTIKKKPTTTSHKSYKQNQKKIPQLFYSYSGEKQKDDAVFIGTVAVIIMWVSVYIYTIH